MIGSGGNWGHSQFRLGVGPITSTLNYAGFVGTVNRTPRLGILRGISPALPAGEREREGKMPPVASGGRPGGRQGSDGSGEPIGRETGVISAEIRPRHWLCESGGRHLRSAFSPPAQHSNAGQISVNRFETVSELFRFLSCHRWFIRHNPLINGLLSRWRDWCRRAIALLAYITCAE